MLACTRVVAVEVIRIWIYSKVELRQLGVGMKARTQSFEPVMKESYLLPPTYIIHSAVGEIWNGFMREEAF